MNIFINTFVALHVLFQTLHYMTMTLAFSKDINIYIIIK